MFQTITTTIAPTWVEIANAMTTAIHPTTPDLNTTTIFANISGIDDGSNDTNQYHMCDPGNPEFNCSVEDFLSFYLGAKQMPLETAIWVSLTCEILLNNFLSHMWTTHVAGEINDITIKKLFYDL